MKGFDREKYPFVVTVLVTFPDGDKHVDAINGLNRGHALHRAKNNWPGAIVEWIADGDQVDTFLHLEMPR